MTHGFARTSTLFGATALAGLLLAGCFPETGAESPQSRPSWLTAAMNGIETGSYAVQASADGFTAVNARNDFRVKLSGDGVGVSQLDGDWSLSIRTDAWGTDGYLVPMAPGRIGEGACLTTGERDATGACLRQVDVERDGLLEWWKNRSNGLEHGYTIDAPVGEGDLLVVMSIDGGEVEILDDQSAEIITESGTVLSYAGLLAWDAAGNPLHARMEAVAGGVQLRVDVENAVWPVEIDPLLSTLEVDQASAWFGFAVSSAGDVNGDGYDDVAVGAPYYDNGQTNEGRTYVFLGSATGASTTSSWNAEANQANAYFGRALGQGDFNGDGYGDLAVAAPFYDNGQSNEGRVYVYYGSASGLGSSATTFELNQASAGFGLALSGAGDVNGDGFDDMIVGAPYYDNGSTDEGGAWTYLGAAGGLSTSAAWSVESNQAGSRLGFAVAGAGDVNNDGYADTIVGAPLYDAGQTNEGRVFGYYGSSTGSSAASSWTSESNQAQANFGTALSGAGDVNNDGYSDVIIGAHLYDGGQTDEGRAYVYHGASTGLGSSAAWTAESNQASAAFGFAVANAGDTNGDGFDDVVVGAYKYDNGETDEGMISVYRGAAGGLSTTATESDEGDQATAYLGYSVASAGDVNGDGSADYLAGAYLFDNGSTNEGIAILYLASGADADGDGDPDSSDCDDTDNTIFNGSPEVCDGVDQDCDSLIDDDPIDGDPYYADADADGDGAPDNSIAACSLPSGYVTANGDCDDTNDTVYTGAVELCDALDNDCNTLADDGAGITWYPDGDLDGYGGDGTTLYQCPTPTGYADMDGDCDDTDAALNPGAAEADNVADDDCDGFVDEDFILDGDLVITEITRQPRMGGSSVVTNAQWFEVYNSSSRDILLDNMLIQRTSSIGTDGWSVDPAEGVIIPAGEYAVFCETNDYENPTATDIAYPLVCDYQWEDEAQGSTYVGMYKDNTFHLQATTDTLTIYIDGDASTGRVLDTISWSYDATNGYWPRDARFSTSLDPLHIDATSNDDEAYWCSTAVTSTGTLPNNNNYRWYNISGTFNDEHGTPGADNYDCPSIP